ncbi:MAG: invertase [Proteobacteria bacterium]|nr:MAG: invertase [Pseudomonadota bacterium]
MARAALYCRVSTPEQSIDPQLDALRAWAATRGHEVEVFTDEGVSGSRASRPGLDALLATVRAGKVQVVACAALDRLGRDLQHLLAVAGELRERNVELVSLREGIDLHSPMGRAMLAMLGLVAQLEKDWITDRVNAGIAAAKKRGVRCGRPPRLDGEAVKRARRMRESGQSLRHVARVLGVSRAAVATALAT